MKTKATAAGGTLALALLLGACGNSAEDNSQNTAGTQDTADEPGSVTDDPAGAGDTDGTDSASGTENSDNAADSGSDSGASDTDQDYMKEKMDKLAYDEFELEVDYGKDQEYEIEIEQDHGVIEATVEDELSGQDLRGRDAFDEIYPKLEKLDITETTTKQAAIQQTLDAFGLKDDYVKFELEITMPDGQKIDFEEKK